MGFWNSGAPKGATVVQFAEGEPRDTKALHAAAGPVARRHLMSAARAMDQASGPGRGRGFGSGFSSEVDMYDQYGPGFVGSYLDLLSHRVAVAGPRLEDLHGVPVHDKQLLAIWRGTWSTFTGPYSSGEELVERMARLRAKKGECFVLELADGTFVVAHPSEIDWSMEGSDIARWLDPVTETYIAVSISDNRIWRSWTQLDSDPRYATSDLERALPHIREYINVKLRQDADVTSPLVRNKLIRFGPDTELYKSDDENDPLNGMPDAFIDYINLAKRQDTQRYHDKRKGVDNVPFPMVGDEVEIIDMARRSDPYTVALEEKAIHAFARAVRVPVQYIYSGPGAAKFENEKFVADALIDDAIVPLGNPVFADLWRIVMKKRMAFAMVGMMQVTFEEAWSRLSRLRIVVNDDSLRPETAIVDDVVKGYQAGAATRQDVADVLGTQMLDTPPELNEFEFWQIARSNRQAAASNPIIEKQQQEAADAIANGEQPKPLPAAQPQETMAAAPAIRAAPSDAQRIIAAANAMDSNLRAIFETLTASAYIKAIDNAARIASRAAPAGDPMKTRLADISDSSEKLTAITTEESLRMQFRPDVLVPDGSFADLEVDALRAIEREDERFSAVAASLGLVVGFRNPVRGARNLANRMEEYTRYRIGSGGRTVTATASIPTDIIRDSLAVTGGAEPRSPKALSAAVNATFIGAIPARFTWVHGYYGSPTNADPEHRSFDGLDVDPITGSINGRYPADHRGCTCALVAQAI